jgi:hypothetical protein
MVPSTARGRERGKAHHSLGPRCHHSPSALAFPPPFFASPSSPPHPAPPPLPLSGAPSPYCPALAPHREAMALRSAAAQAATLLRLRGRPAVTQHLWAPLTRRSISTTQFASDGNHILPNSIQSSLLSPILEGNSVRGLEFLSSAKFSSSVCEFATMA